MTKHAVFFSSVLLLGSVSLFVEREPAAQAPPGLPGLVPVGGIILWWGKASDIPVGFEACDGTVVATRDAVLRGAKPNLQNKFVRGAPDHRNFLPLAFAGGGNDDMDFGPQQVQVQIANHVLTQAQMAAHAHTVPSQAHRIVDSGGQPVNPALPASIQHTHDLPVPLIVAGSDNTTGATGAYLQSATNPTVNTSPWPPGGGTIEAHPIATTSSVGSSAAIVHQVSPATLNLPRQDNRPAYLDMVFIIRVK
jgi:hypothetical protein